jgi:hypothetical protein
MSEGVDVSAWCDYIGQSFNAAWKAQAPGRFLCDPGEARAPVMGLCGLQRSPSVRPLH